MIGAHRVHRIQSAPSKERACDLRQRIGRTMCTEALFPRQPREPRRTLLLDVRDEVGWQYGPNRRPVPPAQRHAHALRRLYGSPWRTLVDARNPERSQGRLQGAPRKEEKVIAVQLCERHDVPMFIAPAFHAYPYRYNA